MTLGLWAYAVAALLGLVMGSAVTALAWRVPRGVSWIRGRSACPSCGHLLEAPDLVPVLSWLASRGRCRHCGAPVSIRYPLTELVCAAWGVLVFHHLGLTTAMPLVALWGFVLVALTWIDLDYQILPDVLTLPGTLIGVAAALLTPGGLRAAMFGMLVGSGTLTLLAWGYLKLRKIEGMGGGDIKLAAMLGAVLGWKLVVLTFFLAALTGSLWGGWLILRKRGDGLTALPFGTLLCPAAMVSYLWGPAWIALYIRFWRGG
jgi:leader peptidase (prepilin peptidase)/N-methyltransferase